MKKVWILIFGTALSALLLSGCGLRNLKNIELPPFPEITPTPIASPVPLTPTPTLDPPPTPTPIPTPTPLPTPVPTPTPTPQPVFAGAEGQVIVNVDSSELASNDPESGKLRILSFRYETPVVSVAGNDSAAALINRELAMRSEAFYAGENDNIGYHGLLEMAEDQYAYARQSGSDETPNELSATRSVRIARADSNMLSLVFHETEDTGGSFVGYGDYGLVFDCKTGKVLTLEDLSANYEQLCAFLVLSMVRQTESDPSMYDHLYVSYVPNRDFYAKLGELLRPGAWYFDEKGLHFVSELYELGPYIAGLCRFMIPYSELQGYLDPQWMPDVSRTDGSLSVTETVKVPNGSISFVDRVEANRGGQEYCLIANGTVYDLAILRVHYEENYFAEDGLLWQCSELKNAALQLSAVLPEGLPNLMIRYTDQNFQTHRLLLTVSGFDGTVHLSDVNEVQPVG